jgi:CheY-like chemotaxis protein
MAISSSLKILVIDDNEASAKTLSWMMEFMGHEVRFALNAQEGMETARQFKPRVIMLDIGLPDINGYELCKLMRKDPAFKDVAFIAQTGWGQQEHLRKSREAGFDYHLVKPIQLAHLESILSSIDVNSLEMAS